MEESEKDSIAYSESPSSSFYNEKTSTSRRKSNNSKNSTSGENSRHNSIYSVGKDKIDRLKAEIERLKEVSTNDKKSIEELSANIGQLRKELKKQLILKAKATDKGTNNISKISSLSKDFESVSHKYKNLKSVEDDTSPNEENNENKPTPIIIISGETAEENVPFIKERDLSEEEKEEIEAKVNELTAQAIHD
ncbi:30268_t:CDS:2 [Racocetra persica]|uniref:30268_t:CDS:1 n=2 Tax=Racocetra persica TaxID=160502 RepID=A0ACA9NMP9_9GLOM|nr:30266_t:CDS:2 [Racocetra persica]CAG8655068.1 30268_t:CDS:2 [Racocetra persica]